MLTANEHYEQGYEDASARWLRRAVRIFIQRCELERSVVWDRGSPSTQLGMYERAQMRAERILRGEPAFQVKAASAAGVGA